MRNYLIKFLFVFSILIFFCGCSSEENFSINYGVNTKNLATHFTDTLTLKTSIYLMDSMETTATNYNLTGRLSLPHIEIEAESFASFSFIAGTSSSISMTSNQLYDSISINLQQEYFYGDSTKPHTLQIYKLMEEVGTKTYYHFDQLTAEETPIGEQTFYPHTYPATVSIKLDNTLGEELVQRAKSEKGLTYVDLTELFKGIKMSATKETENIVGFRLSLTSLKIHYHEVNEGIKEAKQHHLLFYRKFIHLNRDFRQGDLKNLQPGKLLSTEEVKNIAYLHAGIGLFTKIEFPYLESFMEGENIVINKADLYFSPIQEPDILKKYPPPSVVYLNFANQEEDPTILTNSLVLNYQNNAGEYNSIDVISIVESIFRKKENDLNNNLFLTPSGIADLNIFKYDKVNFVQIGGNKYPDKKMHLKLYYTIYK